MQKIALIGRPNVGKSSLFNALLRQRDALVAVQPGLTRDRQYGILERDGYRCLIIDTGGLGGKSEIDLRIAEQVRLAVAEADGVALLVDASDGMMPLDQSLVAQMRRSQKNLWLVVNKIDRQSEAVYQSEFSSLGIQPCFYTAASKGRGTQILLKAIIAHYGEPSPQKHSPNTIRLAIIGRPNVGKSTLINALLKAPRVCVSATPGTTRSAIEVPFSFRNKNFILVDTAGIRRRGRVQGDAEKLSVVQSLECIAASNVALLVCDAEQGIVDQDAHLAMLAIEHGCALVIALNKYDLMDAETRGNLNRSVAVSLRFLNYVERYRLSALKGRGLSVVMKAVMRAYRNAAITIPTAECNRVLRDAIASHPPPLVKKRRIKPRYICQSGALPPRFIISGGQVDYLPQPYKRYLASYIRRCFNLKGTPISIEFRRTQNPYTRS